MKNVSKQICFIALIAVMALVIATPAFSGGIADRVFNGGAKSLAKQSLNLIKQAAALQEKALGIEEKALALSDKDRRVYQAELERLGFQPPEWLFNDAQALLTGAPPAPESPGGILGFIAGIFGGGSRNSGSARSSGAEPTEAEIQAALEAAQQILGGTTAPPATAPTPTPTPATTTRSSGGPTTWTAVADSTFDGSIINAVAWGNNRFVAVGDDGKIAYSADGRTWTAVADSGIWQYPGYRGEITTADINAIAYGNNRFVAGGYGGRIAYSADGVSWTAVADSAFGDDRIRAIAFGNNRFIAVGDDIELAYSTDGISWTVITDNTITEMNIIAIAWGNNRFVVGDQFGRMAYSSDGVRWTAVADSAFGGSLIAAFAWGNNRFVAVGNSGTIAYSADGARWTAVAETTLTSDIHAVAWGNNRFVAVGGRGQMAYSADGASWTRVADSGIWTSNIRGETVTGPINGIAYANGRFVAVGWNGKIAYADW